MLDNDEAGEHNGIALSDELAKRNIWRVPYSKYLDYLVAYNNLWLLKDSNEMLVKYRDDFKDLLKKLYDEAVHTPLAEYEENTALAYFTTFMDRVAQDTYKPIPTPFEKLNTALGGRLH